MTEEEQRIEIQQVLDELFAEGLIMFKLTAYRIQANNRGEFRVHFNDSRIHSCRFAWNEGGPFKEAVRSAVIKRVNQMSGRLPLVVP
jgi:hypothetical protein